MAIGTMAIETMVREVARSWGWIVLCSLIAIAFAIIEFVSPWMTLESLVLVWGIYVLADGLMALIAGFKIRPRGQMMWPLILVGLLGIAAGIATFLRPQITALVLLAFIAAWALLIGVLQVVAAIRLRAVITNEWWLVLSGLISIAFGVVILVKPGAGALAVISIIGAYALLFGIAMVMLGFRIRGLAARVPRPA